MGKGPEGSASSGFGCGAAVEDSFRDLVEPVTTPALAVGAFFFSPDGVAALEVAADAAFAVDGCFAPCCCCFVDV